MNIAELHTVLGLMLARGVDPTTTVVINTEQLGDEVFEWAVVQGVGDPTLPEGRDAEPDWRWVTLHVAAPIDGKVEYADCRWTPGHERD